jgi:hypothetical protein
MSHDKIKTAVRARMARTGEPYAAARRAVLREHRGAGQPPGPDRSHDPSRRDEPRRFLISYRQAGLDRPTAWLDRLLGSGPGRSGVVITGDQLRVRMGDFRLAVPRSSVRSVARSQAKLHGTTGVHGGRGRLLVNGGPDGLVELTLDPPIHTGRGLSTLFTRARVDTLVLSLEDPDGFVTAVRNGTGPGPGPA